MAASSTAGKRTRGNIEKRAGGYRVRVSAGTDPATGERLSLKETVPIAPPGDRKAEQAAYKEAQKVLTRLQGEADTLKVARTKSTFGALLDRWLPQHEIDPTTRMTYESMIRDHIRPVLGDVPLLLLTRDASERLERFYADLRRCRSRCDGRTAVDHRVKGRHECRVVQHKRPPGRPPAGGYPDHDCDKVGCTVKECPQHECKPYAASSIRQVHAIISGALSAAVRWGWIAYNPAPSVRLPAKRRAQPRPPSAADMARIVEAAFEAGAEWGTYVWLSAVTGARRGEVVALQWEDVDLDNGVLVLDENYVRGPDAMLLKDTKTHQGRRVGLDDETVTLLRQHKADASRRLAILEQEVTGKTWLFSAKPDLSKPRDPSAVTRWYSKLVAELGIETQLKELRHYSATELLTAGVDLRTVAGRLGHGDGTTTLRHYAAWVAAADKTAASTIGSRMPRLKNSTTKT
jgi:integrase